MRAAVKTNNDLYYEYVFVYVDDLLHVSAQLQGKPYDLRLKDVGLPKLYLGAKIGEFPIPESNINLVSIY
jgi:hypothetical protein